MNERQIAFNSSFRIPHSALPFNTCHAHVFCGTNTARSLEEFASGAEIGDAPLDLEIERVRAASLPVPLKPIIASRRFFNFCSRSAGKRQPLPVARGSCPLPGKNGVPSIFDL